MTNLLYPQWPQPANVQAFTTLRTNGHSQAPFASNNLGLHVGDNRVDVAANRQQLCALLPESHQLIWLEQTHSTTCIVVEEESTRVADAMITRRKNTVLAIMTADCQPILLTNKDGSEIAAIHAGWKGLHDGIIQNTLAKMTSAPAEVMAWCGPAICQRCYEVGNDVYESFLAQYAFAKPFFTAKDNKWLLNLPGLCAEILHQASLSSVYMSNVCTFENTTHYFSYRKERQTGRIASLIWFI